METPRKQTAGAGGGNAAAAARCGAAAGGAIRAGCGGCGQLCQPGAELLLLLLLPAPMPSAPPPPSFCLTWPFCGGRLFCLLCWKTVPVRVSAF